MIALDTDIVVRLITKDDPGQVARARAAIIDRTAFIQITVLVETERVLRSSYAYSRDGIARAFAILSDTEFLTIEDSERFPEILRAYGSGMDFADVVHLAGSDEAEAFATFDTSLVARARRHFPTRTVLVP